ncbi:MAG TPA: tRNA 2-selenouridine(34) synthase MnmH, partial [Alcanivorax sp.]|nr:tRNA 2-selenouridine(34) synthase MnmH [Alcanivorax sp.]
GIRKRLGGARHQYLRGELEAALDQQRHGGDVERHRVWIRELLSGYYDPMYDYMLQRRDGPILYQGSRAQVMEYLSHRG